MKKFYLITFLLIACVLFVDKLYAQTSVFTYTTPQTLTTGTAVTLKPTQVSGTSVPGIYSQASTIAGSGFYGHKDTLALFSTFANPVNLARAANGDIYVADANLNAIRKISNGVVTTFAGSITGEKGGKNGQDTAARFNYPTGIAVGSDGNIYVADFGNSLIRKITPGGAVTTFAGNQNSGHDDGVGTNASFNLPYSIVFGRSGLLVADTYNHKIRQIAPDGTVTTVAGTGAAGMSNGNIDTATFNTPKGIAYDATANTAYVTEEGNNSVRKINFTTGKVSSFGTGKFKKLAPKVKGLTPIGITVDLKSNVYVSSEEKYSIYKFNPAGTLADSLNYPAFSGGDLKDYQDGTDTLTKYKGNMGLFFASGYIFLTDPASDYIRKVSIVGYSVFPRLPDSLSLNARGEIVGIPTTVSKAKTYTISNYSGSKVGSTTRTLSVAPGPQLITFKGYESRHLPR
jgi:sugar lactone lactonase YvrE